MYAKVFAQIYDGTLCTRGPWEALVTFQQLLVLADQEGNVDMTASAIARRTTIPLEIIQKGIASLLEDDPESRTPTENGRRIMPLSEGRSWGWRIVNYKHYRSLKREEDRRDYHREYWHKRKAKDQTETTKTQATQHTQPNQPIAEAEADTEARGGERIADACPHSAIVDLFHERLPTARQVRAWTPARQQALRARWREDKARQNLEWWGEFFDYIARSDFLCGRSVARQGGKPFEVSMDWICKQENFVKVLEGAYEN